MLRGTETVATRMYTETLAEYVCYFKNSCSSSFEFVCLSLGQLPVRKESESVGH